MDATKDIHFDLLTGPAILPMLPALADFRIRVFREWPYLYEGDSASEQEYLSSYVDAPHALVIVAQTSANGVVGISTALALEAEPESVRDAFAAAGLGVASTCYFGESVLDAAFRGRGIGSQFMKLREEHARRAGFTMAAFCAVERDPNDPRKPADARDLTPFWRSRGFTPVPGHRVWFSWRETGEEAESPKPMAIWSKRLETI